MQKSILSVLAVINFQDATRRAAGSSSSSSFHPKWFKGNDSFFGATQKAESLKRRGILKLKSKGKVFIWNNATGRTQTRQELMPNPREKKDDLF